MIFSIRKTTKEDAQYVMDIDLKCFEYPWPTDFWFEASAYYDIVVGTYYGTPVGMAVYTNGPVICPTFCYEPNDQIITMLKVGVKKSFRNKGLGKLLVNHIKGIAWAAKSRSIVTIAPESICTPSEQDVSGWLRKVGFEGRNIIPGCFTNCGEAEDGYLFEWENNADQPASD